MPGGQRGHWEDSSLSLFLVRAPAEAGQLCSLRGRGGRVGPPERRRLVALALAFHASARPEAPPSPALLRGHSCALRLCTMERATWR